MEKLLRTTKQLVKYGIVASIGLALDFGTVIFAKEILGLHYLLAVCLGFILALILTYTLSNQFVFGSPKGSHKKIFLLFGFIGLSGLVILNLLVWIFVEWLYINYIIAKALATIAVFMWNFFARRTLYHDEVV